MVRSKVYASSSGWQLVKRAIYIPISRRETKQESENYALNMATELRDRNCFIAFYGDMGKATRWFKGLLGIKRSDPPPATQPHPPPKERRRWSFVKSYKEKPSSNSSSRLNARCAGDAPPPPYASVQVPAPVPDYASGGANDPSKHAIVVAAASAAAAEAAVAAAHAAAAVVRLTTSGRRPNNPPAHVTPGGVREFWAALVIQSHFRGYLARRALRALKGLVRLQALVRGHIMRKKTADTMRSIQAMLRAQARARIVRAYDSPTSSGKSSQLHPPGPPTPEKYEQTSYAENAKRSQSPTLQRNQSRPVNRVIIHPDKSCMNSSWSDPQLEGPMWGTRRRHPRHRPSASFSGEDEFYLRPDKILEIDTGKPAQQSSKQRKNNNFYESKGFDFASDEFTHSFTTTSKEDHMTLSPFSCEAQSALNPNAVRVGTQDEDDDGAFCTAENSPHFYSTSSRGSRRSPLTPPRSDASGNSCFSGYSDCPSYMAYTESAKAKMRSLSAPRQRPQQSYDRGGSGSRWSVHRQRAAALASSSATIQASYGSKAYPGSGRLDRLGMPVRNNTVVYYSGYLN